ncbi:MAG: hypothetical protein KDB33_14350, partial [Acidimicrobiales bacterium]|nr:hypothetical protein [Acidimicrobiales bacterium]
MSGGHNFASDGSCGFGAGTDVNSGGDPLLGALADNGGATDTMLPEPGSPLVDAIAPATPGCAGATAQNALGLPQGFGCDIGAAEAPSNAVLAGHVTATHDGAPLAGIEVRVRTATNTYATATTTAPDGT